MTYYNLSFIENVTGITQIYTGINDQSSGWLSGMILITLMFIMMVVFIQSNYNPKDAYFGTMFIVSLVAILMWAMGSLGEWVMPICLVLFLIGAIIKMMDW